MTLTEEQVANLLKSIQDQKLTIPPFDRVIEVLEDPKRPGLVYVALLFNVNGFTRNEHCGHLDWEALEAPGWVDRRDVPYHRADFTTELYRAPLS